MNRDEALRAHLSKLLDWGDAHVSFDAAVKGIPPALRGAVPRGLDHSPWQLVEHLRRAQHDILDFCRNPKYVEMPFPEGYWPTEAAPPSDAVWKKSIAAFRRDRDTLKKLAEEGNPRFYRVASRTEELALRMLKERHPERPNATNVDYYSAGILQAAGFPKEFFTCVFAASRMAGWTAHVLEYMAQDGRIIRPASEWIGPDPDKRTAASA